MSLLTIVQAVATAATIVLVLVAIAIVERLDRVEEPAPAETPRSG